MKTLVHFTLAIFVLSMCVTNIFAAEYTEYIIDPDTIGEKSKQQAVIHYNGEAPLSPSINTQTTTPATADMSVIEQKKQLLRNRAINDDVHLSASDIRNLNVSNATQKTSSSNKTGINKYIGRLLEVSPQPKLASHLTAYDVQISTYEKLRIITARRLNDLIGKTVTIEIKGPKTNFVLMNVYEGDKPKLLAQTGPELAIFFLLSILTLSTLAWRKYGYFFQKTLVNRGCFTGR